MYTMKKIVLSLLVLSHFLSVKGQTRIKTGTLYKVHPNIESVVQLFSLGNKGDTLAMRKFYTDSATFFHPGDFINGNKPLKLKQVAHNWSKIYQEWDSIKISPAEEPLGMDFLDKPFTVKSSWLVSAIFRKTKKKVEFLELVFDEFNPEGKITKETTYFDGSSTVEAVHE